MIAAAILTAALYFASGSNRAGEIRGFGEVRHPIGIVAPEFVKDTDGSRECNAELRRYAELDLPLFVDSGAFSEVDEKDEDGNKIWPPRIVAPITHEMWLERLGLYAELADVFGSNLYAVAPDLIGYPAETLGRLSRYRDLVADVARRGARILCVLQDGRDQVGFWRKVRLLMKGHVPEEQLIPSLPMLKNATSAEAVVEFCAAAQPHALHLLGLGPTAKEIDVPALLADIARVSPRTVVSHDACLIRRTVGKNGHTPKSWLLGEGKRKPRIYTRSQWEAQDEINEARWAEGADADAMARFCDYTDLIAEPSAWAAPAMLKRCAAAMALSPAETKSWLKDPDAFLQEDVNGEGLSRYELPEVAWAVDQMWMEFHEEATCQERKRRGIHRAFGEEN